MEIENVRNNVGVPDGSTLGKFRLYGPDALKVLERVYVSDMSRVMKGRVKYSAMCNEDGCVIDDGVMMKTGENDYYLTTPTTRAAETAHWVRYCSGTLSAATRCPASAPNPWDRIICLSSCSQEPLWKTPCVAARLPLARSRLIGR